MSYFADVKCPKCGKEKQMHLGGLGWYGVDREHCSYCGYEFDPKANCTNMVKDEDDHPTRSNIYQQEIEQPDTETDLQRENLQLKEENRRLKEQLKTLSNTTIRNY